MDNKIRLGNDVRLVMTISPNVQAGFETISGFDSSNVKQLRCYLINTSFAKEIQQECDKKFRRVGFPQFYHPTKYNINNSGYPSYHMMPANVNNYDAFCPNFHDYHWWPGYCGFGVYPERFYSCGTPNFDNYRTNPIDVFGVGTDSISSAYVNDPVYLADSQILPEQNKITCLFPAVQQLICGTYKLIVVLTVFEQGWGRHNLRTYTIDKGDVFELVNDHTGRSGNITINIDGQDTINGQIDEIYTTIPQYAFAENTEHYLGGIDYNNNKYNIYVVIKDGSTAVYNPYDWHFDRLQFESSNENLVKVDQYGHLTIGRISGINDETVQITVYAEDSAVQYNFNVIVKKLDRVKIGFSLNEDVNDMSYNDPELNLYDAHSSVFTVNNDTDGKYLWIFSQRRIQYVQSVEDESALAELSSGFSVPMASEEIKDGYFCYRSAAPILEGDMKIKIKFI